MIYEKIINFKSLKKALFLYKNNGIFIFLKNNLTFPILSDKMN
nr:MAG TPA: hypothetical protein [Caudoviricetes sp.]